MKRCPQCHRAENDDALTFCRIDGTPLVRESGAVSESAGTLEFGSAAVTGDTETCILPQAGAASTSDEPVSKPTAPTTMLEAKRSAGGTKELSKPKARRARVLITAAVLVAILVGFAYYFLSRKNYTAIESIAVLPFVNESGNADVEYLSDGMTETLISSLSQLPKLNVKARSSVFRYKGKDTNAQTIGKELNVQAILNGRVVQRGQDLTLYVELVDAQTGNRIWGDQYNKPITNLISLQNEITRDVSQKLKTKLSGADEQKLAKIYTANTEAYQLYLKGRYHALKLTRSELQSGISYFRQAINIDPNYALAYAGLSDAHRSLALSGEMLPNEVFPPARAAAIKAIEIDDTLAEGHANLGLVIFRYDWDWNAAEKEFKRALELDPHSADAYANYAHLLSSTGRHAEALAEIKHARELDPLNLRIGALEGQFLTHAGQTDEALNRLQKTLELDPNFWLAHTFASAAYCEKGMYAEAITEARKARESTEVSHPAAFLGYALAKSGKAAEARILLGELLKSSTERYVPSYNIAMIYNGLGETDKTLEWLGKSYQQRDPRMVWLKVEPKWNNLRADPRFQDLLRRVGLSQ